ncbi:hypothetical protein FRC04_009522 [Tulasnella sp. 424]|nr:hypothetical protein FRC04_009522 [Tulasnella sp. 424]
MWNCSSIWENSGFQASQHVPDIRPYVSVVWNSSAYPARPVLIAGVSTIIIDETTYGPEFDFIMGDGNSPEPGLTFNFTAGQTIRADVGRRRIYANRATFLDLIGIARPPQVFVTYPILSAVQVAPSTTPELTTLIFYPGFGAYNDELYEEYLDYTVVSGLSATGGLYTAFDVIYILIFGRSLLAALFGGKPIAPFGALASILQRESFRKGLLNQYPGIVGDDPKKQAEATCKFLHDFILELKILDPPKKPSKDSDQTKASSSVSDVENDVELAEITTPNPPCIHNDAAGSSARTE